MPTFDFRAASATGRQCTGVAEAGSVDDLRANLEGDGLCLLSAGPHRRSQSRSAVSVGVSGAADLELVVRELAALVRCGIPLVRALEVLRPAPPLGPALVAVRRRIVQGADPAAAFRAGGEVLPPLLSAAVAAGLRGGDLAGALENYRRHLVFTRELRARLQAALSYPAFLLTASVVVTGFLLVHVLPSFGELYHDLDAVLPAPTRLMLAASRGMQAVLPAVLAVILAGALGGALAALVAGGSRRARASRRLRSWLVRRSHRLPLVGPLFERYSLATVLGATAMALRAGLPVTQALAEAVAAVPQWPGRGGVTAARSAVVAGAGVADALAAFTALPASLRELIAVGERTGELASMVEEAAEQLAGEVRERAQALARWVEPAVLLIMGALIALVVLSLYLPLFHLAGSVS